MNTKHTQSALDVPYTRKSTVAILGAGSWGTAVAIHLARCNHRVLLWAHNPEHVLEMTVKKHNPRYLSDIPFPANLEPCVRLEDCLQQADDVIIAVPSHAFADLLAKIAPPQHGLAWLTKGIDPETHQLISQLVAKKWGNDYPVAVISGPSFAHEVARALPTALTIAGNTPKYSHHMQQVFHRHNVRVYLSDDLIGVQLCGAVKNVLAIACGISDGMNYGANAKAALITRGLAEMSRLGIALGARQETFIGLAGVGDLVLTCTDNQSRNRRFGLLVGQGMAIEKAEKEIGQVVEGKYNAAQVCYLAAQQHIEMPICEQVNAVLQGKTEADKAVQELMTRPPREE